MKLDSESTNLCAFNTPLDRYKYLRLPFGISSAPKIHHRTINSLFSHLEGVDTSMDDIIVYAPTPEEHDRLKDGLKPDKRKVEAIHGMRKPENKTDLTNYLARYIPDCLSARTWPLRKLLGQKVISGCGVKNKTRHGKS